MAKTITIDTVDQHIGEEIGVTDWLVITQEQVNQFADATLDHQFIHVDPEAAAKSPFGGPIAHGFLTLSLLSYFAANGAGVSVEGAVMGINYGLDKVRFVQPVRVGQRVRARSRLLSGEEKKPAHFLFKQDVTVEIEGEDKPALVAEWLTMVVTG